MIETSHTLDRVRELRVDALYGKKKHSNAADRKEHLNQWLGIPSVVINIALGSVFVAFLADNGKVATTMKWACAALALVAALLTGLQTAFNFQKVVEGHRSVATRFLAIAKRCNRIEAYVLDGKIEASVLWEELESLARTYDQIVRDAEAFPTNSSDYEKAKAGFNCGEEEYTDREKQYRGE